MFVLLFGAALAATSGWLFQVANHWAILIGDAGKRLEPEFRTLFVLRARFVMVSAWVLALVAGGVLAKVLVPAGGQ